jgi:DNA-binding LacI/PurR family transcriptional regulator
MAGIAEVAARAGVSKATASRALSGAGYVSERPGRACARRRELGYVPSAGAVGLATGRTQNIGVVMPYVNRWFFAEVLEGIQQALLERGLDLTLYDAKPGTEGRAGSSTTSSRASVRRLIAVGLEPVDHELERLTRIGRPIVSVVGSAS